jgi:hypothetical protein
MDNIIVMYLSVWLYLARIPIVIDSVLWLSGLRFGCDELFGWWKDGNDWITVRNRENKIDRLIQG